MMTSIDQSKGLWDVWPRLKSGNFVDLSHAFEPGIPHAADMPDEVRETLYDFEKDGFQAHRYSIAGQWGTHCDPPIHFVEGARTIDEIRVEELIAPLVVFDVRAHVDTDDDFTFLIGDLVEWERRNGTVPEGSFAVLRTGWSSRWPDPDAMANRDEQGRMHWPGWSTEVVDELCLRRSVVGIGHETTDTDPGYLVNDDKLPAEDLLLRHDRYQIEMLASLEGIPETGSLIVAAFPKPKGGSGFPARVIAIAP